MNNFYKKLRYILLFFLVLFVNGSIVVAIENDETRAITTLTGNYAVSGNLSVNTIKTIQLDPNDADADLAADFETNRIVLRRKIGDRKDPLLIVDRDGMTLYKTVTHDGATTLSDTVTIANNKNLTVTGTLIQGGTALRQFGHGIISANVTQSAATAFTINFTTTDAVGIVSVSLFGSSGGGDVLYDGTFFVSPITGKSFVTTETTRVSSGGNVVVNATLNPSSSSVQVKFVISTPSSGTMVLSSPYLFYEIKSTQLSSVAFA